MRWTFGGVIWGEVDVRGGSFGVRVDVWVVIWDEGGRSGGSFGSRGDSEIWKLPHI